MNLPALPTQADARFCGLLVSGDDMAGGGKLGLAKPTQADARFCDLLMSGDDMANSVCCRRTCLANSGRRPFLQAGGDDITGGGELGLLHPGQQAQGGLTAYLSRR